MGAADPDDVRQGRLGRRLAHRRELEEARRRVWPRAGQADRARRHARRHATGHRHLSAAGRGTVPGRALAHALRPREAQGQRRRGFTRRGMVFVDPGHARPLRFGGREHPLHRLRLGRASGRRGHDRVDQEAAMVQRQHRPPSAAPRAASRRTSSPARRPDGLEGAVHHRGGRQPVLRRHVHRRRVPQGRRGELDHGQQVRPAALELMHAHPSTTTTGAVRHARRSSP